VGYRAQALHGGAWGVTAIRCPSTAIIHLNVTPQALHPKHCTACCAPWGAIAGSWAMHSPHTSYHTPIRVREKNFVTKIVSEFYPQISQNSTQRVPPTSLSFSDILWWVTPESCENRGILAFSWNSWKPDFNPYFAEFNSIFLRGWTFGQQFLINFQEILPKMGSFQVNSGFISKSNWIGFSFQNKAIALIWHENELFFSKMA